MIKKILAIFISSFIGIMAGPEFLTASDQVAVMGINDSNAVETVIVEEPEPVEVAHTYSYDYEYSEPVYYAPQDNIQVAGRTLAIYDTDDTRNDSYDFVYKFGKLLYGHNTWNVFGGLSSMGVGDTFTVNYGGETHNYMVQRMVTFQKDFENGEILRLNGRGNYMGPISKAKFDHVDYDIALMTCAGEMLGGGDATERLVLFASEI